MASQFVRFGRLHLHIPSRICLLPGVLGRSRHLLGGSASQCHIKIPMEVPGRTGVIQGFKIISHFKTFSISLSDLTEIRQRTSCTPNFLQILFMPQLICNALQSIISSFINLSSHRYSFHCIITLSSHRCSFHFIINIELTQMLISFHYKH